MIRREDEMEAVTKYGVQKGMRDVAFHTFTTREEVYGSGRTFVKVVSEPDASVGIHEHQGESEGYYVLKGQALVTDNGVKSVLNLRGYHMCKNGGSHDITCYGDETTGITALIINVPA